MTEVSNIASYAERIRNSEGLVTVNSVPYAITLRPQNEHDPPMDQLLIVQCVDNALIRLSVHNQYQGFGGCAINPGNALCHRYDVDHDVGQLWSPGRQPIDLGGIRSDHDAIVPGSVVRYLSLVAEADPLSNPALSSDEKIVELFGDFVLKHSIGPALVEAVAAARTQK